MCSQNSTFFLFELPTKYVFNKDINKRFRVNPTFLCIIYFRLALEFLLRLNDSFMCNYSQVSWISVLCLLG